MKNRFSAATTTLRNGVWLWPFIYAVHLYNHAEVMAILYYPHIMSSDFGGIFNIGRNGSKSVTFRSPLKTNLCSKLCFKNDVKSMYEMA